jgi:hypothetical protein
MKRTLLFSAALFAANIAVDAQDARKAYAVTGKKDNPFQWVDIKQVDIATGKIDRTLFESGITPFQMKATDKSVSSNTHENMPTSLGVAACALDVRTNRLFFAPMHFSDIRFLDLNKPTPEFTIISRGVIDLPRGTAYQPEENHFTRMAIAPDGYGYAITNDSRHMIRFTTGRKPVVEDLGTLVDAPENKGISIHNKCTSWGGDMLADAFGKLVIISANHNVFTVDVKTKVATHTGTIKGLPANFTTNGAAVNADGDIVVSSANVFEGLYVVNYKTLDALKLKTTEPAFNASDLANAGYLLQKEADAQTKYDVTRPTLPAADMAADSRVYPNPVTNNQFSVSFEGMKAGRYTILFTDLAGRSLQSKVVNVSGRQIESFKITGKIAGGMYMVQVVDESKKVAFTQKIVLQ